VSQKTDHGLENLLALDGDAYVIHESGYWVKFEVKCVRPSKERPHGIRYSLTLHGPNNGRLIGFDNAHAVGKGYSPDGKADLSTIMGIVSKLSADTFIKMHSS